MGLTKGGVLGLLQVSGFKEGGGVDGASSSIYQSVSGTLSAGEGSLAYDDIKPKVSNAEMVLHCCGTPASLTFLRLLLFRPPAGADFLDETDF